MHMAYALDRVRPSNEQWTRKPSEANANSPQKYAGANEENGAPSTKCADTHLK